MSTVTYKKIASDEGDTVPVQSTPPPSVPAAAAPVRAADDHRQSVQFARAAFVFRDRLDDVRKKRASVTVTEVSPSAPSPPPAAADAKANKDDPIVTKRLRFLRLIQSTLTAGLSIAIAALQMKTYISYQHTKDVAGAWPTHPNLLPTLMLMGVAIGAAVFDLSLIVAYLFPKQARVAFRIAMSSYSILTTAKGLSYTLTAVLCRGGYNFGNASGQNNDLWSWTCTARAAEYDAVTNAEANCQGQAIAWYISIAQIAIEAIGVVGTTFIKGNVTGSAASDNPENEIDKLDTMGTELDSSVADMTPKIGQKTEPAAK